MALASSIFHANRFSLAYIYYDFSLAQGGIPCDNAWAGKAPSMSQRPENFIKTMTTSKLISWAFEAQGRREATWNEQELEYTESVKQSVEATKPDDATNIEKEMCCVLVNTAWNKIQDWHGKLIFNV